MTRQKSYFKPLATSLIFALMPFAATAQTALNQYVDTRVGTAASTLQSAGLFGRGTEQFGQTLPAVTEPNGMTFWTPQTRDTEQKCIAPYYFTDQYLQGFRASHWLNGGCTQDYGSMTLMPLFGQLRTQPEQRAARFSHDAETAAPAYYSVALPDEGIFAEMTGRSRTAIFRFTYAKNGKAYLVVNPNSDEGEGAISIDIAAKTITGENPVHLIYQGWGEPAGFSGHFLVEWQAAATAFGVFRGDEIFEGQTSISGDGGIGAYIEFDVSAGDSLLVKAATSFVDAKGAEANLAAEIPHWDFEQTRGELAQIWEQRLALVRVNGNETDMRKFYGAFYRASLLPRTFSDADGRYPAFASSNKILQKTNGDRYFDDFSLWDTYRALHPLLTLLTPQLSGEMMQSLADKYSSGGWLPIFPCWNSYTSAMIGDHAIAAIADAYVKGVRNFDIETAYEAMRKNAFETPSPEDYAAGKGRRALGSYLRYGFIPLEDSVPEAFHTNEQTSRTMEYAFDDFALAQTAKLLGYTDDFNELMRRAANYKNVIDPRTGYASGRHADGQFAPCEPTAFAPFITEGAPCHYTWYAPHDTYGLMEVLGGKEAFAARLDSMFSEGRYWHGNEPCHQIAYMFNFAGEAWKTQRAVRAVLEAEYADAPGGLAGNDDAGQMSAWFVFSAMGFYPVCPASPTYLIGSPLFAETTLCPEGGRPFTIKALNNSEENIYIQEAKLNGEPFTRNYLTHSELTAGGTLELVMGAEPNCRWGARPSDCPPSEISSCY